MGVLMSFFIIYLLGGLTFIPLVLLAVVIHAHLTFPVYDETNSSTEKDSILRPGDSPDVIRSGIKGLEEKFQPRGNQETDVAAGYFAVCREYVPGGVNGKPPERTTPVGSTTISSPSPSVYQSMYRSIFDRKQTTNPLDNKGAGRPQKKGGNIFYVVLRYRYLHSLVSAKARHPFPIAPY
jgi:DNA polymerase zeta